MLHVWTHTVGFLLQLVRSTFRIIRNEKIKKNTSIDSLGRHPFYYEVSGLAFPLTVRRLFEHKRGVGNATADETNGTKPPIPSSNSLCL